MNNTPVRYRVGDLVRMRKEHPCGSDVWEILRVGMDFRLKCFGCGHIVMLARPSFERGVKELLPPGTVPEVKLRPRAPVRRSGPRPAPAVGRPVRPHSGSAQALGPAGPRRPGGSHPGGPGGHDKPGGMGKAAGPGRPSVLRKADRPGGAPARRRPERNVPPPSPEEGGE